MFCNLFLYGIVDWILKTFSLETGGGRDQICKSTYSVGLRKCTYADDGGAGQIFVIWVLTY